jgi:N6-L-threonylcarbamoyladenine synthase
VLVLGIETSCDETAVGIVEDRFHLRANVIASQVELHAPYGGVVPEVAARAHLEALLPTVDTALVQAGAAVRHRRDRRHRGTGAGRGAAGRGSGAKGLALAHDLPLLGVNHLRAHVEVASSSTASSAAAGRAGGLRRAHLDRGDGRGRGVP